MLTAPQTAEEIRKRYTEHRPEPLLRALITGEKGSGKTSLLRTCPKPVLVHSFDPGGTVVLEDEIDSGDILADSRFETDDMYKPTAYTLWEKEYNLLGRSDFFASLGTYCLDSLTTFCTALMWQIQAKEGNIPPPMTARGDDKKGMRIQDWGTLRDQGIRLTNSIASLPCHVILFGHVDRRVDEATQSMVRGLMWPGSGSERIPINMFEYWVMKTRVGKRTGLLTQNNGEYRATTRMGRDGIFEKIEEPDIKALLRKAGYSAEDKPPL